MTTSENILQRYRLIVSFGERFLAVAILAGIIAFAGCSVWALARMDWTANETFYELVYRVLLLVIGLELVRTLITHELVAVLELLAFVVARKMLKPDLGVLEILIGVVAFVILVAARKYLIGPDASKPVPTANPHVPP